MVIEEKAEQVSSTEESVNTKPNYVDHESLNKALDARFAKFAKHFETKLKTQAELPSVPSVQADNMTDETSSSSNKDFAKIERMLKKEREARVELENRLASEKIHNELGGALRGKVSDTWLDIATSQLKAQAKVEGGQSVIEMDGLSYSITEAVSEWIKKPENKRYLPAPTNTNTVRNGQTPVISGKNSKEAQVLATLSHLGITDIL